MEKLVESTSWAETFRKCMEELFSELESEGGGYNLAALLNLDVPRLKDKQREININFKQNQ